MSKVTPYQSDISDIGQCAWCQAAGQTFGFRGPLKSIQTDASRRRRYDHTMTMSAEAVANCVFAESGDVGGIGK